MIENVWLDKAELPFLKKLLKDFEKSSDAGLSIPVKRNERDKKAFWIFPRRTCSECGKEVD